MPMMRSVHMIMTTKSIRLTTSKPAAKCQPY